MIASEQSFAASNMSDTERRAAAHLVRMNIAAHSVHSKSRGRYGWPKSEWWKYDSDNNAWIRMSDGELARAMSCPAFATPDAPPPRSKEYRGIRGRSLCLSNSRHAE